MRDAVACKLNTSNHQDETGTQSTWTKAMSGWWTSIWRVSSTELITSG